jgi:hypothetical protein
MQNNRAIERADFVHLLFEVKIHFTARHLGVLRQPPSGQ